MLMMRRAAMLIAGLLLASTATPQPADARPLLLKMLRGMTPFGAMMAGGRHSSRRAAHHRSAVVSRTLPAAVATAPAAAGAAAAATAGTAAPAAANGTADAPATATGTTGLAYGQDGS